MSKRGAKVGYSGYSVSPTRSSEADSSSWIKTTPTKVKSPPHTSTSKYDRAKHSVPGRDVFGYLAANKETNPTPKKAKKTSTKLSPWEQTQERLSIAWLNANIKERGLKVENLESDLGNGYVLINLIEILSGNPIKKKYTTNPTHRIQQLDNMKIALDTLKEEGLKLVSMDPEALVNGSIKLMLGLITELIYYYHVRLTPLRTSMSMSNRHALLEWLQSVLPDKKIPSLTSSWSDGLLLSALVDYCQPGLISDHASLDPSNGLENIKNAMEIAERELGVPQVILPEDLACEKPEELLVTTYISYFCKPQSVGQKALLDWVNSILPLENIEDFGECWKDGRYLYKLVQSLFPQDAPAIDLMEDTSPRELKRQALEIAEKRLNVSASDALIGSTGGDYHFTLVKFLTSIKALVGNPIPPDSLQARGTGITGVGVNEEACIEIIGDLPNGNLSVDVIEPTGLSLYVDEGSSNTFKYWPTVHGRHTVEVTFFGQHIRDSPFEVLCIDRSLAVNCEIYGDAESASVDHQSTFMVDCSKAGPGEVSASIENETGDKVPATVTEKFGDHYEVAFTPASLGEHSIEVKWNDEKILASPMTCVVVDPGKCEASGSGLSHSILGRPSVFHVSTIGAGEGSLSVSVTGPSDSVDLALVSADDDTCTYKYTPVQPGSYHIDIKFNGVSIHGSPFIVRPQAPTIASSCSVKEFPDTSMPANEPIDIIVNVDDNGEELAELIGTFALEESEEDEKECNVSKIDENLFKVSFTPTEVGVYTVHVHYAGLEIPNCPLNFAVNDPSKCAVSFNSNKLYHIDETVVFEVGTDLAGYGALTAEGTNPSQENFKLTVTEDGEQLNVFTVSFVPKQGGKYYITMLFDNRPLPDMPLCVQIESNTLDNIVLSKPVSQHGYVLVDQQVSFKMFAPSRDEELFSVKSLGVNTGAIPNVSMEPIGEDSYNVSFVGSHPDEYKVHIAYSERQIPGSPFTVMVNQSPQADQVFSFDHVVPLKAGKPIVLTFDASVAGGAGNGGLTANIASKSNNWIIPNVEEISPSLYRVSFIPPREDTYTVSIYWYGKAVKESPFIFDYKLPVKQPKVSIEFEPDASDRHLVSATAVGKKTKAKTAVQVQQFECGKYQISMSPSQEDIYEVHVFWFNKEIKGSPFKVDLCSKAQALPKQNRLEISALVVGHQTGPRRAAMTLTEKKDMATIVFEDRRRDVYDLFVYLDKTLVRGAPFKIDVSD